MNEEYKQEWVLSILADRLSYCMKEECEIFFSFFLTLKDLQRNHFKFIHLKNKDQALNFFKTISIEPSGGDTEVGLIINQIKHEIENNKRLFNLNIDLSKEKPEILVINDGQDFYK